MIAFAILALSLLTPHCAPHGRLPDRACSPGAVATTDLAVICGTRTRTRRHVSEATKRAVLAEYGIAWADRHGWILDHLVSLEVGGASDDVRNVWPQARADSVAKDRVEGELHRLVCSGRMPIAEAQRREAEDWTTAAQ